MNDRRLVWVWAHRVFGLLTFFQVQVNFDLLFAASATAAAPQTTVHPAAEPVKRCNDPAIIRGLIEEQQQRIAAVRTEQMSRDIIGAMPRRLTEQLDRIQRAERTATGNYFQRAQDAASASSQKPSRSWSVCVAMAMDRPDLCRKSDEFSNIDTVICRMLAGRRWLPAAVSLFRLARLGPLPLMNNAGLAVELADLSAPLLGKRTGLTLCGSLSLVSTFKTSCQDPQQSFSCDVVSLCHAMLSGDPKECPIHSFLSSSSKQSQWSQGFYAFLPVRTTEGSPDTPQVLMANPSLEQPVACELRLVDGTNRQGESTSYEIGRLNPGEVVRKSLPVGVALDPLDPPNIVCWLQDRESGLNARSLPPEPAAGLTRSMPTPTGATTP